MVLRRTVTCWLPPACLQAVKTFTFYKCRERLQQLVIEDEQTLLGTAKRSPLAGDRPAPDILFIDFLDPSANASISAVCNLTQRNATLVVRPAVGRSAAARLDAFSW